MTLHYDGFVRPVAYSAITTSAAGQEQTVYQATLGPHVVAKSCEKAAIEFVVSALNDLGREGAQTLIDAIGTAARTLTTKQWEEIKAQAPHHPDQPALPGFTPEPEGELFAESR